MGAGVLASLVLCANARSNACHFLGATGGDAIVLWVGLNA